MDGTAYTYIFDGMAKLFKTMIILCIVFVPLGLWKAVELVMWLARKIMGA